MPTFPELEASALSEPISFDCPLERLRLDPANSRLAGLGPIGDNAAVVKALWTEMSVDEVAISIAANGYYKHEPLLVIPAVPGKADPKTDSFLVVEGNRRLAATLLLTDQKLRERVKATDLPLIGDARQRALQELPSYFSRTRKSSGPTSDFGM